eukprot:TRINITY_DN1874_c0_g1_i6.p1 TRINITY_DN1874_c0_g1~~TRINITY_DN1874_c0_g1_i6.p1  ORF type:complete len:181 (+),score=34.50 TRINITY_DN1874_c0_g1_i6:227-769(+)
MSFPEHPIDNTKVGDIYLLGYNAGSGMTEETQAKRFHYSVVIDIAGESTSENIIGLELHLGADERTKDTRPLANRRIAEIGRLDFFHHLGKIENIAGHDFFGWEASLMREGTRIFHELVDDYGRDWSSSTNCHTYAVRVLNEFGVSTDELPLLDYPPLLIDVGILLNSLYLRVADTGPKT